jgi:hypothetical protein
MGIKHTKALKKRWAKVSPEIRASIASKTALARWNNSTTAERIAQGKMLSSARQK